MVVVVQQAGRNVVLVRESTVVMLPAVVLCIPRRESKFYGDGEQEDNAGSCRLCHLLGGVQRVLREGGGGGDDGSSTVDVLGFQTQAYCSHDLNLALLCCSLRRDAYLDVLDWLSGLPRLRGLWCGPRRRRGARRRK